MREFPYLTRYTRPSYIRVKSYGLSCLVGGVAANQAGQTKII
jgi:uncharacterized membrane-anchored protein